MAIQAAKPKTDAAATNPDGKVTLLNCSGRAITVKSFDANDNEMVVPEQTNPIADGQALTVNCKTSDCKLTIENIKTAPVAGPLVYTKGKVTPSDQATVAKGCGAFK